MTDATVETGLARYHATFQFDRSGHWLVELDEIPQVHSFGRTLGKAREYLVDALALWLDQPADKVAGLVEFRTPTLPADIRYSVALARAARELAEAETRVAVELNQKAAAELVNEARLSMRDAADLLGLSHQRVQQLVAAHDPSRPRTADPVGEAAEGIAKAMRQYLPGGSKQDLGVVFGIVAAAGVLAWAQSSEGSRALRG